MFQPVFRPLVLFLLLPVILSSGVAALAAEPPSIAIARDGVALLPIHVSAGDDWQTDETLAQTVHDFQGMLTRITAAEFVLDETATNDAAAIRLTVNTNVPADARQREQYRIVTNANGLTLSAVTPLALRHAVWDFCDRLGYRQFFPGKTWEIVPTHRTLTVALDVQEAPDYTSRRIWYGYGLWEHNREDYANWCARNRMAEGLKLNTGHAYGRMIRAKKADFDQHPEYYALRDGKRDVRGQAKLCIGNPQLRQLVRQYAVDYFTADPGADSISVDPSDGGGWCECDACAALGKESDQALVLANAVAEAVNEQFPGKYVGMYAYSFHSPPPSSAVNPNVIISAATGFIRGGLSIDQIMSGWQAQGATMGVREYYSVHTWDRDLPGAARGSNLEYLATTIPKFYSMGARYLSAESSDNWGCNGLGYYFASRMLWDVNEATRRDEIVVDFLSKAFGPAQEPMAEFYTLIEGSNKEARLVYDDLLARMYRLLQDARKLAVDDASVLARLNDLVLYTRYVELFDLYRNASGGERQAAFEQMIRHGYRMRGTYLIHAYGLYRDLDNRDKTVTIPENAGYRIPEPNNPWKSSEPFSIAEIEAMLSAGIASYQPVQLDFERREFSEDLVAATSLSGFPQGGSVVGEASLMRGARSFYTVVDKVPQTLVLRITGGLIAHYRDRGNVKVGVWKIGGASDTGEKETLVFEDNSVPPDGVERTITFAATEPGVYRMDVNDGSDMTRVTWPDGQQMTWRLMLEDNHRFTGRWTLSFYVPQGTKTIGLYSAAGAGQLRRPDGKPALDLATDSGGFLSAPVPVGMDNALWTIHSAAGKVALLNVPPWTARSAEELVLPVDAVE